MGWTGTSLGDGRTVRSVIIDAYQGDPLSCAACGWHELGHPRVTGSEYDAIYGPRPEIERPAPHAFAAYVPRYRVRDYALVALSEAYLAVETIETGDIWAGVALVHITRGAVTYKDMSEEMGPGADRCPARILDALTPTTDPTAAAWRASCRARLDARAARPKVGPGARVRFAEPLTFTNGATLDRFALVKGSTFRAFADSNLYRISSWRERAYTVEV